MSSIYDDASQGTLTPESLTTYLATNPKIINWAGSLTNKTGKTTPLIAAVRKGHLKIVKLLLKNSADPNFPAARYTPLYYATLRAGTPKDRPAIVRALLDGGASVDNCSVRPDDYTPLMNAIEEIPQEVEVIHELLDHKAKVDEKRGGKTARELAKERGIVNELEPRDARNADRGNVVDHLVAVVKVAIGWANSMFGGFVKKRFGVGGVRTPLSLPANRYSYTTLTRQGSRGHPRSLLS